MLTTRHNIHICSSMTVDLAGASRRPSCATQLRPASLAKCRQANLANHSGGEPR